MPNCFEHQVAIVAFEGISPFHLSVPCTVFGDAWARLDAPRYKLSVCAEQPGQVQTLSGFTIGVTEDFSALHQADTIIIPAWYDPDIQPSPVLLKALQHANQRGARIVGLCLGAFVLAEAGLLEGRTASTHWAWAEDFSRKYPNVQLDCDVLYMDEGNILTSAGTAAAIDCCLYMVRCDHGAQVANELARRLVTAPHRSGGMAQYIEQPLPGPTDNDRIAPVMSWAIEHLNEPLCLDRLAERAAMSRRNFSRQFRKVTGTSVSQWLLSQRLSLAQRLLETSDQSIEHIAQDAGFNSAVSFRQHFSAAFSITPRAYRKQFR